MRRSIYLVLAALGLVAFCAGLVFWLVDVNQFRGTIQAQLERQLKRRVTMGELHLEFFPLAIRVQDVVIGESPQFPTGRPFARAKSVQVRTGLLPLLRKELRIDSFDLQQPEIELVRNARREWNFSDLGGESTGGGGGSQVTVSQFEIADGTLAISDLGNEKSRTLYEHVDITLSDIEAGKPFRLRADAQLPGSGKDSFHLEGTGGPLGGTGLPFNGRLSLKEAPLAGLVKFVGSTLPIAGLLTGTADLRSTASLATAAGRLELKNGTARGKELGIPVNLDFEVADDLATGVVQAKKLKVVAQNVAIEGSGEVNTKASSINGRLRLGDSSLRDVLAVARLFGAETMGGSGRVSLDVAVEGPLAGTLSYSGSGQLRDAEITTPALAKPLQVKLASMRFDKDSVIMNPVEGSLAGSTLRGSVAIRNFVSPDLSFDLDVDRIDTAQWQQIPAADSAGSGGKNKPVQLRAKGVVRIGSLTAEGLALTNVRSECVFDRGVLTLSPLSAQIFDGSETGSLTLDTRARPPALTTNLTFKDVDANNMLSATTSLKNVLYGLFGASGQARLNLTNSTEMASSLNGDVHIGLVKGRLAGTNVLNQLAAVSQFLGYSQSSQTFTNIVKLAGDLKIVNGLARTENLQMQVEGGTLAAAGTVNLADQALNLKVTAVLDREMSQKVGGTRIGGYMQTALANSRGELVIPALVSGTLAQPHFAPDAARMAEMKLKNLLPSAGNPLGVLGNLSGDPKNAGRSLLDALAGKPAGQPAKPDPAKPAAQQEKPDIFGTIDSLIRSKKKQ